MKTDIYKDIFVPDSGALLDIRVFEVMPDDWQKLLDYLSSHYQIVYEEHGQTKPLPRFDEIIKKRETSTASLKIGLPGLTVNCYFFDANQIEMDILPEEVDSPSKAEVVFELMIAIAHLLNKEVLLMPEAGAADPETLRRMAICSADPKADDVKCHLQHP